jgi:hypothetical protein
MSEIERVKAGDALPTYGSDLLETPPWSGRLQVLTLLGVQAPSGVPMDQPARLWLILDTEDIRDLDDEWRIPLLRHRLRRVYEEQIDLTVTTSEGVEALLDGSSRRSLEARWEIRHSAVVHDPRGRFVDLSAAVGRLPDGMLERITRPLYIQAYRAFNAMNAVQHDSSALTIVNGEAASALSRLACVLEDGAHPSIEWLLPAARDTSLGRRITPWLDGFTAGVAAEVLSEVARVLRTDFPDKEWLKETDSYILRAPLGRN